MAVNDAQAAAWGEYRFGAGRGEDLVFLTISTGVGGGIVAHGTLMEGLAGHFGLMAGSDAKLFRESEISGLWMAGEAKRHGFAVDAREVFERARRDEAWAKHIVAASAGRVAALCRDIQLILDPPRVLIGGGIGLATGYLDQVRAFMRPLGPVAPIELRAAELGARAGVLGVADIARARSA